MRNLYPPQIFVIIVIIISLLLFLFLSRKNSVDNTNSTGIFCGGIANIVCPQGYKCILDGNYPDAGVKCTKSLFP